MFSGIHIYFFVPFFLYFFQHIKLFFLLFGEVWEILFYKFSRHLNIIFTNLKKQVQNFAEKNYL